MNIFYTNQDPVVAANEHCLIHQNKMIVEYAQLLSTAHNVLDGELAIRGVYKKTHVNHPSAVWCRSSDWAYEWVLDCALELCKLYTTRTSKIHKTESVLNILKTLPSNIQNKDWQDPPVAAPDKFKALAVFDGVCKAYQEYLKDKFVEWCQRDKPLKVEFVQVPEWY